MKKFLKESRLLLKVDDIRITKCNFVRNSRVKQSICFEKFRVNVIL